MLMWFCYTNLNELNRSAMQSIINPHQTASNSILMPMTNNIIPPIISVFLPKRLPALLPASTEKKHKENVMEPISAFALKIFLLKTIE
jgi:hypothetical protein